MEPECLRQLQNGSNIESVASPSVTGAGRLSQSALTLWGVPKKLPDESRKSSESGRIQVMEHKLL